MGILGLMVSLTAQKLDISSKAVYDRYLPVMPRCRPLRVQVINFQLPTTLLQTGQIASNTLPN